MEQQTFETFEQFVSDKIEERKSNKTDEEHSLNNLIIGIANNDRQMLNIAKSICQKLRNEIKKCFHLLKNQIMN